MRDRSLVSVPKKGFREGTARPFNKAVRGHIFHGFIVKKASKYFAYQNMCRHLSVTLDADNGDFFTHDKKHLQCHLHGAIYEIDTGLCIGGPCEGARLIPLDCVEEDARVIVLLPEGFGGKAVPGNET